MLKYTQKKEESLKDEMYAGEVQAQPYEMGNETGCDYCAYRDICGFDPKIDGCTYRKLEKYSMEEAAYMMMEAVAEKRSDSESAKEQQEAGGLRPAGRQHPAGGQHKKETPVTDKGGEER